MRRAVINILLVMAMLVAGTHAPALAHRIDDAAAGLHHDHDDGLTALADRHDESDRRDAGQNDAGQGADIGHHHHCPAALPPCADAATSDAALVRQALTPGLDAALVSRAPAPLLEPPAA